MCMMGRHAHWQYHLYSFTVSRHRESCEVVFASHSATIMRHRTDACFKSNGMCVCYADLISLMRKKPSMEPEEAVASMRAVLEREMAVYGVSAAFGAKFLIR